MMKSEIVFENNIKEKIFTIRGVQVMCDFELAKLYGVETRNLNKEKIADSLYLRPKGWSITSESYLRFLVIP
ncbi:MAG: ORF6N domain-containing protein [Nanoarchaeota archaeon]